MAGIGAANELIERLPKKEAARFLADCDIVDLELGATLHEFGRPVRFVYFPLSGFASLVAEVSGRPPMEVGLVGREGMVGATLAMAIKESPFQAVVQGPGASLRVDAATFHRATNHSAAFPKLFNRYLYELLVQLANNVACTNFHAVEPRLARSLLMVHDRAHAAHFRLTHEVLAGKLGVQRSAVTIAAGALQQRRLIDYSRGDITIVDRAGLEAASCACYGAPAVGHIHAK